MVQNQTAELLRSAPLHRNRTSANLLRTHRQTHRPRCVGPLSATHFELATSGDGTEAGNILGKDGADRRDCGGPRRQVVLSRSRAVDLEGDEGDVVLRALLPGPTLDPP